MNACIFTGSGFSKAIFDQAIQNEFCKDFLDSEESKMFEVYLPDEFKNLIRDIGDIEKVMSYYFDQAYPSEEPATYDAESHMIDCQLEIIYFRMALALYFREKFKSTGIPKYKKEHQKILHQYFKKLRREYSSTTIITTNYDLGFEQIIDDLGETYYYPGFESLKKIGAIPILKIHGSINWMEDRDCVKRHFQDITRKKENRKIVDLDKLKVIDGRQIGKCKPYTEKEKEIGYDPIRDDKYDTYWKGRFDPYWDPKHPVFEDVYRFTLAHQERKYSPLIVPFFYQKEQWAIENVSWHGDVFKNIWQQTTEAIEGADKLVFWGYGLPTADCHVSSYIEEILNNNQPECDIIDYNTQDTNLIRTVKKVYESKGHEEKLNIHCCGVVDYIKNTLSGMGCW